MAKQKEFPSFHKNWTFIKDSDTGIEARFPSRPLEMTFEIPFQNTPPIGSLRLYSVPKQKGVFVLSILNSSDLFLPLDKDSFKDLFERLFVPRLFYYPHVFQEEQSFFYTPQEEHHAFFEFHYRDHGIEKMLKGKVSWNHDTLYTYFYLASEEDFDEEECHYFLTSIHLPKLLDKD